MLLQWDKVTRAEYIRLKELEKSIAFLNDEMAIHKGFDYGDHPVIRPTGKEKETERVQMQWGFLPGNLSNEESVRRFRNGYKDDSGKWHTGYTTLNATSEELLNKIYRDAALRRRCLIPSHFFIEWMHVRLVGKRGKILKTPERFPYKIEMTAQPEFYIAGIWQPWTNRDTGVTTDTFSMVTTSANSLMKQINNAKERMPAILPGDLAEAWLYHDLREQEILDIANYQVASAEMKATPLYQDFLKRETPFEAVIYPGVPELAIS